MAARITFTPNIDQQELQRITSVNASCFAGFIHCRTLPEAFPTTAAWHLYPSAEGGQEIVKDPHTGPCRVPVFALARDARAILLVDALSIKVMPGRKNTEYPEDRDRQHASVHIARVLKGEQRPNGDPVLEVVPFAGVYGEPDYHAEDLTPGRRYIVFADDWPLSTPLVAAPLCGVFEDSPQIESEVEKGLALNDHIGMKNNSLHLGW